MKINTFDIVFAVLPDGNGSVQGKSRLCVVIQNEIGCVYSPTIVILPLSSQLKKLNMPTHFVLHKTENNGLNCDSLVLGEQVVTISKENIVKKIGTVKREEDKQGIRDCYIANLG